jgi:hypothetical protein
MRATDPPATRMSDARGRKGALQSIMIRCTKGNHHGTHYQEREQITPGKAAARHAPRGVIRSLLR